MTVSDLCAAMNKARDDGYGNADVSIICAGSGNPDQTVSATFPILEVVYTKGLQLVRSNYVSGYARAVVADREPA